MTFDSPFLVQASALTGFSMAHDDQTSETCQGLDYPSSQLK